MSSTDHPSLFETPTKQPEPVRTSTPDQSTTPVSRAQTRAILASAIAADDDFEWYPTTPAMIAAVAKRLPSDFSSIMDIGAGDGRVLMALARAAESSPALYSIEKSVTLANAQPDQIIPVGTDFYEQNLSCLPADYIFCNPPYSDFEGWAAIVIETAFAKRAWLVIPQRWKDSERIQLALQKREAKARVIYSGDFHDADRRARAVVDVVEISFPTDGSYYDRPADPFDAWFDAHVHNFDAPADEPGPDDAGADIHKQNRLQTIAELVEAFNEEYARMESNYHAIFKLDHALIKELGISKQAVRDAIKLKMSGLKTKYWQLLFNKMDAITSRLSTKTKESFLKRLTGRQSVAFTAPNAYAVVVWAIKHANKYYDEQLVQLFRDLSTFDGVSNYKSNQRTWQREKWRYMRDDDQDKPREYALDYRIVLETYSAIAGTESRSWDFPGGLAKSAHEKIDDIIAVMSNLGFTLGTYLPSRQRQWESNQWQDFYSNDEETLIFQVKAFKNGNLHFRFRPDAIRALNVAAGRLLGWIKSHEDVVTQLGYSVDEAERYFNGHIRIGISSLHRLTGH